MSEDSRVYKTTSHPLDQEFSRFGTDGVQVDITVETKTLQQGFDFAKSLIYKLTGYGDWNGDVSEVPYLRSVIIREQVSVTEDQITPPVRIAAYRKAKGVSNFHDGWWL